MEEEREMDVFVSDETTVVDNIDEPNPYSGLQRPIPSYSPTSSTSSSSSSTTSTSNGEPNENVEDSPSSYTPNPKSIRQRLPSKISGKWFGILLEEVAETPPIHSLFSFFRFGDCRGTGLWQRQWSDGIGVFE
jgi:hypothetical protein